MTPIDVSDVLAKAALFDNRIVGDGDVLAWTEAIGDLDREDALIAVALHYQETTTRLMPADVRRHAAEIHRARVRLGNHQAALQAAEHATIGRGPVQDRSAEVTALVQQVVEKLTTPDTIHERAKLRARREHGRPDLSRKPGKTRPRGKAKDWPPPADDAIAALATRYLIDDHAPDQVADKLYISRRWCRRTITHLRNGRPSTQEPTDASA